MGIPAKQNFPENEGIQSISDILHIKNLTVSSSETFNIWADVVGPIETGILKDCVLEMYVLI